MMGRCMLMVDEMLNMLKITQVKLAFVSVISKQLWRPCNTKLNIQVHFILATNISQRFLYIIILTCL